MSNIYLKVGEMVSPNGEKGRVWRMLIDRLGHSPTNANRIAIIGISGSGKSTLSRKLAESTGLPLYHMDLFFWKENWNPVPEEEYLKSHQELVEKDRWIIEGYIDKQMANRIERADLVIYLDYSGSRSLWNAMKRMLKHHGTNRPELPAGCLDKFNHRFLWTIFTRGERKDMEAAIDGVDLSKIVRVRSPKELRQFFKKFLLK